MMAISWQLIYNPASGRGKTEKQIPDLITKLKATGINLVAIDSEFPNHITEIIIKALKSGQSQFIIVGGDGMINQAVNAVLSQKIIPSTKITLAFIPTGTGNDLVRAIGMDKIDNAIKNIVRGTTRLIDAGVIEFADKAPHYFVSVAGGGFDAYVVERIEPAKKMFGNAGYFIGLISCLSTYKNRRVRITANGKVWDEKIFTLAVGNNRFFGGGMLVCPGAEIDDGQFYVTLIKDIGKFEVIAQLPRLYKGTFINHPKIDTFATSLLKLDAIDEINLQAEGERVGTGSCIFKILPQSLKVISDK